MKFLQLFEAYHNSNLDIILDKISKEGYDSLSDKEKDFLKGWFPEKTYKPDISYENEQYKIIVERVECTNNVFNFHVVLYTEGEKIDGLITIDFNGIIRSIDLYNPETDEEYILDDYYELDKLVQEMLDDYLRKQESYKINESAKGSLIEQEKYIKKSLESPNGFEIKAVIKVNAPKLLDPKWNYYVPLTYDSLMRFLAFMYILVDKNVEKSELCKSLRKDMYDGFMSDDLDAYSRIPTNNMFYDAYVKPVIKMERNKTIKLQNQIDLELLEKIWNNRRKIFNNYNIIYFLNNTALKKIRESKKSEKMVMDMINNKKLLYGGWIASEPTKEQDFKGVDIVLINEKGRKSSCQVKNFGEYQRVNFIPENMKFELLNTTANLDVYYDELKSNKVIRSFEHLILVDMYNGIMFGIPSKTIIDFNFKENGIDIILDKNSIWGKDIRREDFEGIKKEKLKKKAEFRERKKKDKMEVGREKWKNILNPGSSYDSN